MVAREATEAVKPAPVTGRRYRRKEKYTRHTMRRATIFGTMATAALLAYTIPYAMAAKDGYEQNKIRADVQELARQNEVLQTQLATLKNPQMIEAYAQAHGMLPRDRMKFVTLPEPQKAAPKPTLLSRIASLGFR